MKSARAAFQNLVSLAAADGEISREERELIERYRLALGLSKDAWDDAGGVTELAHIEGPPAERVHVLQMMARVAWADGKLTRRERARLKQVAAALGIGRLQYADILVNIERQVTHRHGARRALVIVATILGVGLLVVLIVELASGPDEEQEAAERKHIASLETRIDRLSEARARRDAKDVESTWDRLLEREKELARRMVELERKVSAPAPAAKPPPKQVRPAAQAGLAGLAAELKALKLQLERTKTARTVGFKEIERRYRSAVLLVLVQYDLVRGRRRMKRQGSGTGFFVAPTGLIVTNKHVIQPWKYVPDVVRYLSDGYAVDEKSVRIFAWVAGSRVFTAKRWLNLLSAYRSDDGSLAVVSVDGDRMKHEARRAQNGAMVKGRFHVHDNSDLALLKARVSGPVECFRLLVEQGSYEKLDPVMVLGFPTGIRILEGFTAETSPSVGVVRKIEDTVFLTAPIVGGNSGGPAVDAQGRVMGVATRTFGDASLACCIKAEHVVHHLPAAQSLLTDAVRLGESGEQDAALHLLDLAALRGPTADQKAAIAKLRSRFSK